MDVHASLTFLFCVQLHDPVLFVDGEQHDVGFHDGVSRLVLLLDDVFDGLNQPQPLCFSHGIFQ